MLARSASRAACSPPPSSDIASNSGRGSSSSSSSSSIVGSSSSTRHRRRHRQNHVVASALPAPSAFRPCIDIHKGKVKQIVGSTLSDLDKASSSAPVTNFESSLPPSHYSSLYKKNDLRGGHVIMLGADEGSRNAAEEALAAWPGALHVGGGINASNAARWLEAGASHVIVTSAVFRDGRLDEGALRELVKQVGKDRLVLDLSCRRKKKKEEEKRKEEEEEEEEKRKEEDDEGGEPAGLSPSSVGGDPYFVVTDRWQKYSDLAVGERTLGLLAESCSEFLVHAVDVEGKSAGIDEELISLLGQFSPIPVTYAGGASTIADLDRVAEAGKGRVDVTVGSALDIFGGGLPFEEVVAWSRREGEERRRRRGRGGRSSS